MKVEQDGDGDSLPPDRGQNAAFVQRLARRARILQAGLLRIYLVYAVVAVLVVLVVSR